MAAENAARLAGQIRQNQNELQDYLRDLDQWQKDMDRKDEQLIKNKSKHSTSKPTTPPIRDTSKIPPKTSEKEPKINAYDYKKWDSFDVDKAMKDLDDVNKPGRIIEITDNDSVILQEALIEKERGNQYFKQGKYQEAVKCYTKGLECDSKNAALAANRAMAYLKINMIKEAEDDCTLAISLDPTYIKAYARRASARSTLKRYKDAIEDYKHVLELEPANKLAKLELEKLGKKIEDKPEDNYRKIEQKNKNTFNANIKKAFNEKNNSIMKEVSTKKISASKTLEPGEILPIDKPPHLRSKEKMRRIPITEVGDVNMEEATKPIIDENFNKSTVVKTDQKSLEEEITKKLENLSTMNNASQRSFTKTKFKKPKTFVEFNKVWTNIGANLNAKTEYLKLLKSNDYSQLFKHSLEPKVFNGIIEILSNNFMDNDKLKPTIPQHLLGLSQVPRISALIMFLESSERKKLDNLLMTIQSSSLTNNQKKEIENILA